jgi:phytoene desaturase
MTPHAVVIGAGFGGIAAALRLRARGYRVTLIDKQDQLGGRATVYRRNGFVFDAGPTVITAPFLFDELFALFGKRREDYVTFVPLYPWYRIIFADGSHFDYGGTLEQTLEQIRKFHAPDADGYLKFLAHSKRIFGVGFEQLGDKPFTTIGSMIKVAPQLLTLGTWRTVWRMTCKYIKNENLRRVFSFQPLLVGGNPFTTTSIYSLIHYLERQYGVHFAMGGTGAIVNGLQRLIEEEGIETRLDDGVGEIEVKTSIRIQLTLGEDPSDSLESLGKRLARAKYTPRVMSVRLKSGKRLPISWSDGDIVVCNGEAPFIYKNLIAPEFRPWWTDARIDNLKYSMGLFVLYFGTTRQYPEIPHHTILLGHSYKDLLHDMFDRHKLEMSDFSIYLHRPTATDPSMAPVGCDSFYALVPVPNLQGGQDWKALRPQYRDLVIDYLQRRILPDLRQHITEDFFVTPEHFRDNLNTLHGTGFSIQPTFRQSAYFRFHNKSEDIANLYFVGAATHPGAGLPGVLCSAKVLEHLLPGREPQMNTDEHR